MATAAASTDAVRQEDDAFSEEAAEAELPVVPEGDEGLKVVDTGNGMTFMESVHDFKSWGVTQLVCFGQYLGEVTSRRGRTVDMQLTERVVKIGTSRAAYVSMAKLALHIRNVLQTMEKTHSEMAYYLRDMSMHNSGIPSSFHPALASTSGAHLNVIGRNQLLVLALESFSKRLTTHIRVAIDDTLSQVPHYKQARIEYDAYRNALESVKVKYQGSAAAARDRAIEIAEDNLRPRQERFQAVRQEMLVRVRFLEQNETSVIHKQLVLLQNATCAFYSGKTDVMMQCLKEFHIKTPKRILQFENGSGEEDVFKLLSLKPKTSQGALAKLSDDSCSSQSASSGESRAPSADLPRTGSVGGAKQSSLPPS